MFVCKAADKEKASHSHSRAHREGEDYREGGTAIICLFLDVRFRETVWCQGRRLLMDTDTVAEASAVHSCDHL